MNFSDLPDEEVTNCFNFALKKIDPGETDVMMVMYPVGPLLLPPGEVKNNDTSFRGPRVYLLLSVRKNAIQWLVQFEKFLAPVCGPEAAALRFVRGCTLC